MAVEPSVQVQTPQAAPPNVRIDGGSATALPVRTKGSGTVSADSALTLWSIGSPTDEEQYYLELINRDRADPTAAGVRMADTTDSDVIGAYNYFSVDLNQMKLEISAFSAQPPLAMSEDLTTAARLHSQDMLDNEFQGHTGSDDSTLGERITAQGYSWSSAGENVYAYAKSVWHGHCGFQVDWGDDDEYGMQGPPRGHREAIMSSTYTEVGIGVVLGSKGSVGPQLVTQDFAKGNGTPTGFVTGVAYYDLDGDGFYSPGEGIGGVRVEVTGSSYYAITADSGGYAVPVGADGSATVSFSEAGFSTTTTEITVSDGKSVKVDFTPSYQSPTLTGPTTVGVGVTETYHFDTVGGATAYRYKRAEVTASPSGEDVEDDLASWTLATTADYDVVQTAIVDQGAKAIRLMNPTSDDQYLTLNREFLVGDDASISLRSRHRLAAENQVARVQVSTDGATWVTVWSDVGAASDESFSTKTISLANYAGETLSMRLVYEFSSGSIYKDTTNNLIGWYVDDIGFTNCSELTGETVTGLATSTFFTFNTPSAGGYLFAAAAEVGGRWLPYGDNLTVDALASFRSIAITVNDGNAVPVTTTISPGNYQGTADDDDVHTFGGLDENTDYEIALELIGGSS